MFLATLGWLMVILSIHVQYYVLLLQRYTVLFSHTKKSVTLCVVLIEFFRSMKVVLVVFIKPSLTIQLQLAEILILFHLLSLYVCHWLCLGNENNRYCSEDTKIFLLWKQRLEIMLRAAQGLAYLHELQVIYGDFKS
ncbi:BnaA02g28760D [Brassica napus]|uniref:BnaA02g28760D protein n=1 Tax=Brassica napus TaxID=3708 RepID=A0A078H9I9_BRANA|nr:BnaA02g28760D [Brassica napus]